VNILETDIAHRLGASFRAGQIAWTDGYATMEAAHTGGLTCAAVLIPLVRENGAWSMVFTRRTDTVESHKGQVSFPGGACDPGELPEQTALREAEEEVGLQPGDVRVLGRLNDIVTITGYRVSPVVGVAPWPYPFQPSVIEVSRIFTIPLTWLGARANWEEIPVTPQGMPRSVPVVTYHQYDGEIVWGATARMVQCFLAVLTEPGGDAQSISDADDPRVA